MNKQQDWKKDIQKVVDEIIHLNSVYDNDMAMNNCNNPYDVLEKFIENLLTLSESRVRGEEREKLRQSVELFMNTHDRLDKSFNTDDFIKFVTEEI